MIWCSVVVLFCMTELSFGCDLAMAGTQMSCGTPTIGHEVICSAEFAVNVSSAQNTFTVTMSTVDYNDITLTGIDVFVKVPSGCTAPDSDYIPFSVGNVDFTVISPTATGCDKSKAGQVAVTFPTAPATEVGRILKLVATFLSGVSMVTGGASSAIQANITETGQGIATVWHRGSNMPDTTSAICSTSSSGIYSTVTCAFSFLINFGDAASTYDTMVELVNDSRVEIAAVKVYDLLGDRPSCARCLNQGRFLIDPVSMNKTTTCSPVLDARTSMQSELFSQTCVPIATGSCQAGYSMTPSGRKCLRDFGVLAVNQAAAFGSCVGGATLPVITDQTDFDELKNFMASNTAAWIDDKLRSATYHRNSRGNLGFEGFFTSPELPITTNNDCIVLDKDDATYKNVECTNLTYSVVCEQPVTRTAPSKECPIGWVQGKRSHTCYKFITTQFNFSDANVNCAVQDPSSRVPVVKSIAELQDVLDFLTDQGLPVIHPWIFAQHQDLNGFVTRHGLPVNFTTWDVDTGEPNMLNNCTIMLTGTGWMTRDCASVQDVLCQIRMNYYGMIGVEVQLDIPEDVNLDGRSQELIVSVQNNQQAFEVLAGTGVFTVDYDETFTPPADGEYLVQLSSTDTPLMRSPMLHDITSYKLKVKLAPGYSGRVVFDAIVNSELHWAAGLQFVSKGNGVLRFDEDLLRVRSERIVNSTHSQLRVDFDRVVCSVLMKRCVLEFTLELHIGASAPVSPVNFETAVTLKDNTRFSDSMGININTGSPATLTPIPFGGSSVTILATIGNDTALVSNQEVIVPVKITLPITGNTDDILKLTSEMELVIECDQYQNFPAMSIERVALFAAGTDVIGIFDIPENLVEDKAMRSGVLFDYTARRYTVSDLLHSKVHLKTSDSFSLTLHLLMRRALNPFMNVSAPISCQLTLDPAGAAVVASKTFYLPAMNTSFTKEELYMDSYAAHYIENSASSASAPIFMLTEFRLPPFAVNSLLVKTKAITQERHWSYPIAWDYYLGKADYQLRHDNFVDEADGWRSTTSKMWTNTDANQCSKVFINTFASTKAGETANPATIHIMASYNTTSIAGAEQTVSRFEEITVAFWSITNSDEDVDVSLPPTNDPVSLPQSMIGSFSIDHWFPSFYKSDWYKKFFNLNGHMRLVMQGSPVYSFDVCDVTNSYATPLLSRILNMFKQDLSQPIIALSDRYRIIDDTYGMYFFSHRLLCRPDLKYGVKSTIAGSFSSPQAIGFTSTFGHYQDAITTDPALTNRYRIGTFKLVANPETTAAVITAGLAPTFDPNVMIGTIVFVNVLFAINATAGSVRILIKPPIGANVIFYGVDTSIITGEKGILCKDFTTTNIEIRNTKGYSDQILIDFGAINVNSIEIPLVEDLLVSFQLEMMLLPSCDAPNEGMTYSLPAQIIVDNTTSLNTSINLVSVDNPDYVTSLTVTVDPIATTPVEIGETFNVVASIGFSNRSLTPLSNVKFRFYLPRHIKVAEVDYANDSITMNYSRSLNYAEFSIDELGFQGKIDMEIKFLVVVAELDQAASPSDTINSMVIYSVSYSQQCWYRDTPRLIMNHFDIETKFSGVCNSPVGLQNLGFPSCRLKPSSVKSGSSADLVRPDDTSSAWEPKIYKGRNEWMVFDFPKPLEISGMKIIGLNTTDYETVDLVAQYSRYEGDNDYWFNASTLTTTSYDQSFYFASPVIARQFKIIIDLVNLVTGHTSIIKKVGLKAELYFCAGFNTADFLNANMSQTACPISLVNASNYLIRSILNIPTLSLMFVCAEHSHSNFNSRCFKYEGGSWTKMPNFLHNVLSYDPTNGTLFGLNNDGVSYVTSDDIGCTWSIVPQSEFLDSPKLNEQVAIEGINADSIQTISGSINGIQGVKNALREIALYMGLIIGVYQSLANQCYFSSVFRQVSHIR